MIGTSKLESTRQPKITDFSKEQMFSKGTVKILEKSSHTSKCYLWNKNPPSPFPLTTKFLLSYPHSPLTQSLTTGGPANQFSEPDPSKMRSWILTWPTNPFLYWQASKKFTFPIINKSSRSLKPISRNTSAPISHKLEKWPWSQLETRFLGNKRTLKKLLNWIQNKCGSWSITFTNEKSLQVTFLSTWKTTTKSCFVHCSKCPTRMTTKSSNPSWRTMKSSRSSFKVCKTSMPKLESTHWGSLETFWPKSKNTYQQWKSMEFWNVCMSFWKKATTI